VKTISIRQPWAAMIVDGPKRIENRGARTYTRGWVLIHSALTFDETALNFQDAYMRGQPDPEHVEQNENFFADLRRELRGARA
jgi:hypothetical protein